MRIAAFKAISSYMHEPMEENDLRYDIALFARPCGDCG